MFKKNFNIIFPSKRAWQNSGRWHDRTHGKSEPVTFHFAFLITIRLSIYYIQNNLFLEFFMNLKIFNFLILLIYSYS